MAGVKRPRSSDSMTENSNSPFVPMFEAFRRELDEHQDRRERVIKASRDITALSKKMIFSLQRVRSLKAEIPPSIVKENVPRQKQINDLFTSIAPDLHDLNTWRYQRNISGGIQEFMEAISFQHYLETQNLITLEEAQLKIPASIILTEDDYVLGLFDLVGELMRFAITCIATNGILPQGTSSSSDAGNGRDILTDLRSLRSYFESLDITSKGKDWTPLKKDMEKKMEVMRTSVEKVEGAVYGMIVRGRERPKGWISDLGGTDRSEAKEVEIY